MDMNFELEAWLMRILSWGHQSKQPQSRPKRFDRNQLRSSGEVGAKASGIWHSRLAKDINRLGMPVFVKMRYERAVVCFSIADGSTLRCGRNPQAL
jgi:hypothetical protein